MTLKFKTLALVSALAGSLLLTACGQKEADSNKIKVGVISGAEEQVAEVAKKVAKQQYGLDVELVSFSDYITPNAALADGSLDVNAFQHKPYLDQQIADRGYKLAVVGNSFVYPIAGYSKKIKNVSELADGASVALPNDPTNLGRSLLLLQAQGLIKLKDGSGLNATLLDVVDNPKKLKLVELEAPQLPRSLDDVDLAIINTTYASQIGLT
ncbi:MAG: MetQ/NlpA family lipoprotein, partial [Plesiomonas shigelloides]